MKATKKKMGFSFIDFLVTVTFFGIIAGALLWPYYECHTKAEKQGLECSWGIIQGCMIKIDGKWVDYDRFRIMD